VTRSSTPSLPGIYFAAPVGPRPMFPRLDIAGFVGYAERGPTDLPVAIEDPRQYERVFGGDLALARTDRGEPVVAHLPGAVRSFFANGGLRCHVVRVAGASATAARYAVPGLVAVSSLGDPRLATVAASSVGRWANETTLAARLDALPLPFADLAVAAAAGTRPATLTWAEGIGPSALDAGDLLRLTLGDGRRWLLAIAKVVASAEGSRALHAVVAASWELGLAAGGPLVDNRPVARLTEDGASPIGSARAIGATAAGARLTLDLAPGADEPRPGDILVLDPGAAAPAGTPSLLLGVQGARLATASSPPGARSFDLETGVATALAGGAAGHPLPDAAPGSVTRAERLRFEMRLRAGAAGRVVVGDLAFGLGGPRWWHDVTLTESGPGTGAPASPKAADPAAVTAAYLTHLRGSRPREARAPLLDRTVLGGLLAPVDPDAAGVPAFLPVAMPAVLTADPDSAAGPVVLGSDDLGSHTADPFVDAALATVPPVRLMADALQIAVIDERRLNGMHALALVEEVALVAVPDAVHAGWEERAAELPVPPPPVVPPAPFDPCPPDEAFLACDRPPTITAVTPGSGHASVATPIVIEGSGFLPGPVEVMIDGQPAGAVDVLRDDVLTCTVPGADASPPHGSTGVADVVVRNADGVATLAGGFVYVPDPLDPSLPALLSAGDPGADPATPRAIQAALVRLCNGRRDAVALLDLPADSRLPEATAWLADLRSALGLPRAPGPGDSDLTADLSFAAAYHPWLLVARPDAGLPPRAMPPSGAVAGVIAAREVARGAWIAPANDPMRGVRALEPDLSRDDWAALFAAGINLVRAEADDFRPMSAHTLSDAVELRQLSVRRLLILLRRAALERGMDYVFESNHERFREGVGSMLRALLRRMHEAGAFAGDTPEQSFRVDTSAAVNPPAEVDQGRFVALVQVAPSQPAEFLTVELTRTGQGALQVAGA
jgi:hypothetical protein